MLRSRILRHWLWAAALFSALGCGYEAPPPAGPDDATGTVVDLPEPEPGPDPCIDLDQCSDPFPGAAGSGGATADAGPSDAGSDAGPSEAGAPPTPKPGFDAGDTVLVRAYASFRKSPDTNAATITAVAPGTGVDDAFHYSGMPAGVIPPGQHVVLLDSAKTNGHYQVKYDGHSGWILAFKLVAFDAAVHPVDFAMQTEVQNAFYKNQLHRGRWNKDGPQSSGNCAPTSLAMALAVFGLEKPKLSVEQSIHHVRLSYGDKSDKDSTQNSEIAQGAAVLGLKSKALPYTTVTSTKMDAIDAQLDKRHVLQLAGEPGDPNGGGPTTYQKAMNDAYAADGLKTKYTYTGHHSIFVLGRTKAGKYVVGDPISEVGMVTLTRAQLRDFVSRWGGSGNALWRPQ